MYRKTDDQTAPKEVVIFSTDIPGGKSAVQLSADATSAAKQKGYIVYNLLGGAITPYAVGRANIIMICGPQKPEIEAEVRTKFSPVR
jgi:hypothetical protein